MKLNLDVSKIKGLIFDLDGTLADTMPLHLEAWNEVGKPYGLQLSQEDHLRYAGMPTLHITELLAKQNGISLDARKFVEAKEILFSEVKLPQVKPIAPVAAFLYELQEKMPMAIGTGSTMDIATKLVQFLDVAKYVKTIVSADDVEKHKPAPDTFLACAERIGISPENCLVFEDAQLGMEAAKAGGMQAINIMETSDEDMAGLLVHLKKV